MEDAHQTWEMLVGQIVGSRVFSARRIIIAKLDAALPGRGALFDLHQVTCERIAVYLVYCVYCTKRALVLRIRLCWAGAEQQENRASRLRPFWLVTNY